ncbi:unnamed protein product [Brassicogethes aeneus]|uniref:Uncharacterized protein n=1 Tax=Brassicogethes aeneus TaxID=1431903 RepID=A0A9P0BHB4_BRAAE|nr:unnamed protein product [Brassicogethes aeneus]
MLVKEETLEDGWIAFHQIETMHPERMRDMLEAIFHKDSTKTTVFTNKPSPPETKSRERRTYAIVVENKGNTYEDTLKTVKMALKDKVEEGIRSIRSTKDGRLLITTDKDQELLNKDEDENSNEDIENNDTVEAEVTDESEDSDEDMNDPLAKVCPGTSFVKASWHIQKRSFKICNYAK